MQFSRVKQHSCLWVALVLIGLAGCAGPAAEEAATPTASLPPAEPTASPFPPTEAPAGETFTSERFGYTMVVPPGWIFRDKPGEWADFDPLDPRNGRGIDVFAAYLNSRNLAMGIGARPVAEGS